MGDLELLYNFIITFILGLVVYNAINVIFTRNLLHRFGIIKATRRDFYECGFRPQNQKPIKMPIQFILICIFFLAYDIELVFLFPLSTGFDYMSGWDFMIFGFFFGILVLGLFIDLERHALSGQL